MGKPRNRDASNLPKATQAGNNNKNCAQVHKSGSQVQLTILPSFISMCFVCLSHGDICPVWVWFTLISSALGKALEEQWAIIKCLLNRTMNVKGSFWNSKTRYTTVDRSFKVSNVVSRACKWRCVSLRKFNFYTLETEERGILWLCPLGHTSKGDTHQILSPLLGECVAILFSSLREVMD